MRFSYGTISLVGLSLLIGCGELPVDEELEVDEAESGLIALDRITFNGLSSTNGGGGVNGLFSTNGGGGVNGLLTQNGGGGVNGLGWFNGLGLVNGAPTWQGLKNSDGFKTANGLLYLGQATATGAYQTDNSALLPNSVYQVQDRDRIRNQPPGGCVAAGCSAGFTCQKNPASYFVGQCEADTPTACVSDAQCASGYLCNLTPTVRIWNASSQVWQDKPNPDVNTCERRTATRLYGIGGLYSSVAQTYQWAAANGDSLACRDMPATSPSCKNGLSVSYGLKTEEGLKSDGFLMQSEDGRKLISYLARCSLGPEESITKTYAGTTYQFKGQLGLGTYYSPATSTCGVGKYGSDPTVNYDGACGSWRNAPVDPTKQEWISACLLAHVNTAGNHVDIWIEGDHPWLRFDPLRNAEDNNYAWKGRPRSFSAQEGAFFGNVLSTASSGKVEGFYCDGFGVKRGVAEGRLGAQGWNRPYANAFPGNLCGGPSRCNTNNSQNVEGYTSCVADNYNWNNVVTIWRKDAATAYDFEAAYSLWDSGRWALSAASAGDYDTNGKVLHLKTNATVTGKVEVHPGNNTITVKASGIGAVGVGAHMLVKVAGTTVINTYVTSATTATFSGTYSNAGIAEQKTVTIDFDNDAPLASPPADRMLNLETLGVDDGADNREGWSVVAGSASLQRMQGNEQNYGCYSYQRYFGSGALKVLAASASAQTVAIESARKSFVGPGRFSLKIWLPGNGESGITNIRGYAKNASGVEIGSGTPTMSITQETAGRWVETSMTLAAGQKATKIGVSFSEAGNYTPTITEVDKSCVSNSDCKVNSCNGNYCSTQVACSGTDMPSGANIPSILIDAVQYDPM